MNNELAEPAFLTIDITALQAIADDNWKDLSVPHKLVSKYRAEQLTNKDYNDRQLLELLQNADDAGSDYVKIILNSTEGRLQIINSGTPFSLQGFRSLMVPNLSTKTKKQYIGNKGLGFRSILNWSEEVTVTSAGVQVNFSKLRAQKQFNQLYKRDQQLSLLKEYEYKEDALPFPIFAVPEISIDKDPSDQTTIEIKYLENQLTDIIAQLDGLLPEVLLFLNHIEEIQIVKDGEELVYKASKDGGKVQIGKIIWTIFDNKDANGEDPVLPIEYRDNTSGQVESEESYSLKIAVRDDLGDNTNRLFSYFPTKISLNFPAVIHGTFELDSSRNRIISSPKNTFLIQQLLALMFKVANQVISRPGTTAWNKFRFLNYKDQKDVTLNDLKFYDAIDASAKSSDILPCLDGVCRSYANVNILPPSFTELIEDNRQEQTFPELVCLIPEDQKPYFNRLFPGYLGLKKYAPTVLKQRIETVSRLTFDKLKPTRYAEWIAGVKSLYSSRGQENVSILYTDKNKIAGKEVTLFSPSKNSEIDIPTHVNIDYINSELFDALVDQWHVVESPPSRKVRDELENFTELQPFEPVPVLNKIITETNTRISGTNDAQEKRNLVKAMLKSLLGYFSKSGRAKNTQIRVVNIPVISATGAIIFARNSFLSDRYPTGKLRKKLLGDLYAPGEEIADPVSLGIDGESDPENFLVDFLGVNRFVVIDRTESQKFEQGYNDYIFSIKGKPDKFRDARISYSFIRNTAQIQAAMNAGTLIRENFIAWLTLDPEIKALAESFSDTEYWFSNSGQSSNSWPNRLYDVPSFIRYQLRQFGNWTNYLLETEGIDYLNSIEIDFKARCFLENKITPAQVKETLKLAGAKNEFSELSISRISEILRSMPDNDPLGKQARKVYMLCTDRYRDNREGLQNKSNIFLHATLNGVKDYHPWNTVFYARNIGLPARITSEKPILNYPKRAGEQYVVNFFGVQTFDNLKYTSGRFTINEEATKILAGYLRQLRPFILLRRLSRLRKDADIREAVKTVKTLRIHLCNELYYFINGEERKADDYDFVQQNGSENIWLIQYNGIHDIELLKKDSVLSDVISEIYSISFDLANLSDEIRFIYRDDYADTRRRMILEFGEDALANAMSKLEVSDSEKSFWESIFSILKLDKPVPPVEDERDFRKVVSELLEIDKNLSAKIDFENLEWAGNAIHLQKLLIRLGIELMEFNAAHHSNITFFEFHRGNAFAAIARLKPKLTNAYWGKCSHGSLADKSAFTAELAAMDSKLADRIAESFAALLEADYYIAIWKEAHFLYGIANGDVDEPNGYKSRFTANSVFLKFSTDQINRLAESDRSLLYFSLSDVELERIKQSAATQLPPQVSPQPEPEDRNADEPAKNISELEKGKPVRNSGIPFKASHGNGYGGNGSHNSNDDQIKKAYGLKAEKDVLRALKGKIVEWVSGYSDHPSKGDRWGYDIRFREAETDDWNYAEVKWFGSGTFYFSGTELYVARQYPENYFLYLVTENAIKTIPFAKLLKENGELDSENEYLSFDISEYKFFKNKAII